MRHRKKLIHTSVMSSRHFFGTDGIRGKANLPPLDTETVLRIGKAAATIAWQNLRPKSHRKRPIVLIGHDTRLSSDALEASLAAGIVSCGADALIAGILPTPAISLLAASLRVDVAVSITASHNPFEDNGIKFFSRGGHKFPDHFEEHVEKILLGELAPKEVSNSNLGQTYPLFAAKERYVENILKTFPSNLDLDGMRVVLDCANGASFQTSPQILSELGAEVHLLNASPNGLNINENCGSQHPEFAAQEVVRFGAQLGIAHDGDADRVVLIDEKGLPLDGDEILAIAALDLIQTNRLPENSIVATVMSNYALDELFERHGGKVWRTKVGDRFVAEEMERRGVLLGGEQSGHIIFREFSPTGDGILCALQILRILLQTGKPLSTLRKSLQKYPQIRRDFRVNSRPPLESIPQLSLLTQKIEKELQGKGRILLRYSGTEPVLRLLIEGNDVPKLEAFAAEVADVVEEVLH